MANPKKAAPAQKRATETVASKQSAKKKAHPGLGRGLGALIAPPTLTPPPPKTAPKAASKKEPDDAEKVGAAIREVPVDSISRSPWQPRTEFEPEALKELCDSIKEHGVIQPLICRRNKNGYELIAGERRLRAAADAGLETVPVLIIEAADRDAAEMAIIENIQREDLNIIEEAEGYRSLADSFGMTQQEVADRVGKSRAGVANAMRLLDLPDEVKQLLISKLLSVGHAKILVGLPSEDEQTQLARRCVTDGLTVRMLEKLLERLKKEKQEAPLLKPDFPDSYRQHLLGLLKGRFSTQVRLSATMTCANGRRRKGVVEIDYYSKEDLTRILGILGVKVE